MTPEQSLLSGQLVDPGHPVAIAYLVMCAYPDVETALWRGPGSVWPAALYNQAIPGSGEAVREALDLLRSVRNGVAPQTAVSRACARWHQDYAKTRPALYDAGQAQADHVLPRFYLLLEQWLPEQDRALAPPEPTLKTSACTPNSTA